jgi:hypothetical protein
VDQQNKDLEEEGDFSTYRNDGASWKDLDRSGNFFIEDGRFKI